MCQCRGQVAEWLNAAVLKTVERASVPGVRIPPCPPFLICFFPLCSYETGSYETSSGLLNAPGAGDLSCAVRVLLAIIWKMRFIPRFATGLRSLMCNGAQEEGHRWQGASRPASAAILKSGKTKHGFIRARDYHAAGHFSGTG